MLLRQYCQIIKQTTNNKSERANSCARGWRLLVIATAFIRPSDGFERFLRTYLQSTALNSDREFQAQGIICLRNLKQTMKYGGRKVPADVAEVTAVLVRRWLGEAAGRYGQV